MGYMSVFFFLNDCHGVIEKDPNFGKVIANTISAGYGKKYVDVQASSGQVVGELVAQHHADEHMVTVTGANCAHVLHHGWGWSDWRKAEVQEDILRAMADNLGFKLVRK